MNEKTKDILIRAGKTFWQAALAYLLGGRRSAAGGADRLEHGQAAPALARRRQLRAAGFSAVYNGIVRPRLGGE